MSRGAWLQAKAMAAFFAMLSSSALSADPLCFSPRKGSRDSSSAFVDPQSKVCRAFQRELNASCAGDIPSVEFEPGLVESGLSEPAWEPMPLYEANGAEIAETFALLEKLIRSRAVMHYSSDREARASREVTAILGRIREAHTGNRVPRFDKALLDLEGRGRKEQIYRLYSGLLRNPASANEAMSTFKSEPELFLERAIALAASEDSSGISPHAAGSDVTGHADVLLFDGTPYFLRWSGGATLLIYASYLQKDRPHIYDERVAQRTFVIPSLRCMFDVRPTH